MSDVHSVSKTVLSRKSVANAFGISSGICACLDRCQQIFAICPMFDKFHFDTFIFLLVSFGVGQVEVLCDCWSLTSYW